MLPDVRIECDIARCVERAEFVLRFRDVCAGGRPMTGPKFWLLCGDHRELLLNAPFGQNRLCAACGQRVTDDLGHVAAEITGIDG